MTKQESDKQIEELEALCIFKDENGEWKIDMDRYDKLEALIKAERSKKETEVRKELLKNAYDLADKNGKLDYGKLYRLSQPKKELTQ